MEPESTGLLERPPTAKRVLFVLYSQTGQLAQIAERVAAPLRATPGISIHVETLVPRREHPYPWPFFRFLDAFPECTYLVGEDLEPPGEALDGEFDLIVLCYQVWFLAPSMPATAFLRTPQAARLLAGKPVVTVIACRNMWMLAHRRMQQMLATLGARHLDNVVLTDEAPTLVTLLTTPLWLLTGRKQPISWLPPAGVASVEIERSTRFGHALRDALLAGHERGTAPLLAGLQAVHARPRLLVSEHAGTRSFQLWGRLIRRAGPPGALARVPLLALYAAFLIVAIVTIVPISLLLQTLLRPFLGNWLAAQKSAFEAPSGSGTERLALYDQ
ncbi:MAG: dialkylresorcinol condensing enzyme [Burkholderiaceae bacterium]